MTTERVDDPTDEIESTPGYKPCVHCHDGGACLPGGCGVPGCERCGKVCPHCKGTCEVPVDDLTDLEVAVKNTRTAPRDWFTSSSLNEATRFAMHEAAFIEKASPARIGELIAEVRRLRELEAALLALPANCVLNYCGDIPAFIEEAAGLSK